MKTLLPFLFTTLLSWFVEAKQGPGGHGVRARQWPNTVFYSLVLFFAVTPIGLCNDLSDGIQVDVGGYRLYIQCLGTGKPAVVFDAGLAASSNDWKHVQTAVGRDTRTCIYDRAGYGLSEPGPMPRTSHRIAAELRTLLNRASISPPFLLVGHSFGGYNMRSFASLFTQETAGLVLLDPPSEYQLDNFFGAEIVRRIDPNGILGWVWRPSLLNSIAKIDLTPIAMLLGMQEKTLQTIVAELGAFHQSGEELRLASIPETLPLVMIMHGQRVLPPSPLGNKLEREWSALQRDYASKFSHGRFIIADKAGHSIPTEQPEVIVDAIRSLLGSK